MLCGGMFKFLVAARKEGKIQSPNPDFDDESVRYEHRQGNILASFGETPSLGEGNITGV